MSKTQYENSGDKEGCRYEDLLRLSLLVAQGILNGEQYHINPRDSSDRQNFLSNGGKDDLGGYLKLTYILMDMLRSSKKLAGSSSMKSSLKSLFTNKELLIIFLGLGYERYNVMDCFKPEHLKIGDATLEKIFQAVFTKRTQFHGLLSSLDNVNFAYSSINDRSQGPVEASSYGSFVSGSTVAIARIVKGLSVVLNNTTVASRCRESTR